MELPLQILCENHHQCEDVQKFILGLGYDWWNHKTEPQFYWEEDRGYPMVILLHNERGVPVISWNHYFTDVKENGIQMYATEFLRRKHELLYLAKDTGEIKKCTQGNPLLLILKT